MCLFRDFVRDNSRIEIISSGGKPIQVPNEWGPILGDAELLIAIPDMHMFLHGATQDTFSFGAEALASFLDYLLSRQHGSSLTKRMHVVQLGDMFELQFPHPRTGGLVTIDQIRDSHSVYARILTSFRRLGTRYILGNHDFEHHQSGTVVETHQVGQVYMEHGFSADAWYRFTDPGIRVWPFAMKFLKGWRRAEAINHQIRISLGLRDPLAPTLLGSPSGEAELSEMPDRRDYPVRQLKYFSDLVRRRNIHGEPTRVCIIAHTHQPRIDPQFAAGSCIFIDAGAWTDGRSDFAVITNRRIALCRYRRLQSIRATVGHGRRMTGEAVSNLRFA